MNDEQPLYNSRVVRVYIQYLRKNYPSVDTDLILSKADMANYQIQDPAHWFTQKQQDRFHDILIEDIGDPDIARKAGRFAASSEGLGAAKQYILGLMSPMAIYLLMEKLYPLFEDYD